MIEALSCQFSAISCQKSTPRR